MAIFNGIFAWDAAFGVIFSSMIIPPLFAMGYAETHYKFRLPWSPLHEPWPEIFLDAPCRLQPSHKLPVWLVLRDADLYPTRIHRVMMRLVADGRPAREWVIPLETNCEAPFHFIPLDIDLQGQTGMLSLHAKIDAERLGVRKQISNWNYPGLTPTPLRIHALRSSFPKPAGWWSGETHCHTWHSSDPVEFGAPPLVLQQAARALGLDFVMTTDHSYDFCFRNDNYRIAADPSSRWRQLQEEFADLPTHPLMIPGEEVSCGNAQGKNVHLLVPGHPHYLPGLGDSGRRWFSNQPDLSLGDVLEAVSPIPCFAAHPQAPMGWIERSVFRRGSYQEADLHLDGNNPIAGLEFWNGPQDRSYHLGRAFWIRQLLAGNRILPIAGNDAHGDLNRFTGVKIPLISLHSNRERLFGRAQTVVKVPTPSILTPLSFYSAIRAAQQTGTLYCSDGPSLQIQAIFGNYQIQAESTPDFGAITELRLFHAARGASEESHQVLTASNSLRYEHKYPIPANSAYLRVECTTNLGFRAISAACWADAPNI